MSTFSIRLSSLAISTALALSAMGAACDAFAQDGPTAGTAEVVENATSTLGIVSGAPSSTNAVVTHGDVRVAVPETPRGSVSVSAADGSTVAIGLPVADASSDAAVSPAGTVTYGTAETGASAVQPLQDGVRILAVTAKPGPQEFRFPLDLPTGTALTPRADGGYDITQQVSEGVALVKGSIDAPWAKDATGAAVATHYRLEGSTLTQIVEPDASTVGAVVADPKLTWGIVTGTAYLNKSETEQVGQKAGLLAFVTSTLPPPFNVVAGLDVAVVVVKANEAKSKGQCLKLKLVTPLIVPGSYSGGNCK